MKEHWIFSLKEKKKKKRLDLMWMHLSLTSLLFFIFSFKINLIENNFFPPLLVVYFLKIRLFLLFSFFTISFFSIIVFRILNKIKTFLSFWKLVWWCWRKHFYKLDYKIEEKEKKKKEKEAGFRNLILKKSIEKQFIANSVG